MYVVAMVTFAYHGIFKDITSLADIQDLVFWGVMYIVFMVCDKMDDMEKKFFGNE